MSYSEILINYCHGLPKMADLLPVSVAAAVTCSGVVLWGPGRGLSACCRSGVRATGDRRSCLMTTEGGLEAGDGERNGEEAAGLLGIAACSGRAEEDKDVAAKFSP